MRTVPACGALLPSSAVELTGNDAVRHATRQGATGEHQRAAPADASIDRAIDVMLLFIRCDRAAWCVIEIARELDVLEEVISRILTARGVSHF